MLEVTGWFPGTIVQRYPLLKILILEAGGNVRDYPHWHGWLFLYLKLCESVLGEGVFNSDFL